MASESEPIDGTLFPNGIPKDEKEIERTIELYKLMVASSESLVARRQGGQHILLDSAWRNIDGRRTAAWQRSLSRASELGDVSFGLDWSRLSHGLAQPH